jgi:hypothetical protein
MIRARLKCLLGLAFVLCCTGIGAQQVLPPPLPGGSASDARVVVQILRWHMLDSHVSARVLPHGRFGVAGALTAARADASAEDERLAHWRLHKSGPAW